MRQSHTFGEIDHRWVRLNAMQVVAIEGFLIFDDFLWIECLAEMGIHTTNSF